MFTEYALHEWHCVLFALCHTSHPDLHPIKDETTGLDGLYWCVDYPWPMWDRDVSMGTMVKLNIIDCKKIANIHVLLFAVALPIKSHCWQLIKIWLSGEPGPRALCSLGICFGWIPGRSALSTELSNDSVAQLGKPFARSLAQVPFWVILFPPSFFHVFISHLVGVAGGMVE